MPLFFSSHLKRFFLLSASLIALSACSTIGAENSCTTEEPSVLAVQKFFNVGMNLEKLLDSLNEEVVILGRQGQDLTRYNIHYSHTGFAIKMNSKWRIYHLLNECPSDQGGIYQEGLGNFITPALQNLSSASGTSSKTLTLAYTVPPKKIQQQIQKLIVNKARRDSVFESNYSAVAHPYNLINQNSNGWILEFFSVAEGEANGVILHNRDEAHAWLKEHQYQGSELPASILKQRLATLFVGNISLKGHERRDRYQGKLLINSGDSILNYFAAKNPDYNCSRIPQSSPSKQGAYCELRFTVK